MRIKNLRQNNFFPKETDDNSFRIDLFKFQRNQNKSEFTLLKMFQQSLNIATLSAEAEHTNKSFDFFIVSFSGSLFSKGKGLPKICKQFFPKNCLEKKIK
jgi:hypothetical protein